MASPCRTKTIKVYVILARADKALNTAKAEGRSQVVLAGGQPPPSTTTPDLLELSNTEPGPHGAN